MTDEQQKQKLAELEAEWKKNYRKRKIIQLKLGIVDKEMERIKKEIESL